MSDVPTALEAADVALNMALAALNSRTRSGTSPGIQVRIFAASQHIRGALREVKRASSLHTRLNKPEE